MRRQCYGDLIQIVGSDHRWFKDRADPCTLLVFIDDATSTLMELRFMNPLPNAETLLSLIGDWIEDYKDNHPHSGLKWKLHREFIRAKTKTTYVSGETGAGSTVDIGHQ